MRKIIFLLLNVFSLPSMAFCQFHSSITDEVFNETGKPLVANIYLHWQIWKINNNSSNFVENNFISKSIGGVSYYRGKDGMPGNMQVRSCSGPNDKNPALYSRSYDLGISVGPFNFLSYQGSSLHWNPEQNTNYLSFLLDMTKWSELGRDYHHWNIYVPDKKYYSVKHVLWPDRAKCTTTYKKYSICWANDLRDCNYLGSCDTFAAYYINNLGLSAGNLVFPQDERI